MPTYDDAERNRHNDVMELFRGESDRGAALVGAAFLDELLKSLLIAYLVDPASLNNREEQNALANFLQRGSLGTFSNRINLAFALGFLSKRDYDDLHLIRRIRNDFAHALESTNFGDQSICDHAASFAIVRDINDSNITNKSDFSTPRRRFMWTVSVLYGHVINTTKNLEHRTIPTSRRVQMLNATPLNAESPMLSIRNTVAPAFGPDDEVIFISQDNETQ